MLPKPCIIARNHHAGQARSTLQFLRQINHPQTNTTSKRAMLQSMFRLLQISAAEEAGLTPLLAVSAVHALAATTAAAFEIFGFGANDAKAVVACAVELATTPRDLEFDAGEYGSAAAAPPAPDTSLTPTPLALQTLLIGTLSTMPAAVSALAMAVPAWAALHRGCAEGGASCTALATAASTLQRDCNFLLDAEDELAWSAPLAAATQSWCSSTTQQFSGAACSAGMKDAFLTWCADNEIIQNRGSLPKNSKTKQEEAITASFERLVSRITHLNTRDKERAGVVNLLACSELAPFVAAEFAEDSWELTWVQRGWTAYARRLWAQNQEQTPPPPLPSQPHFAPAVSTDVNIDGAVSAHSGGSSKLKRGADSSSAKPDANSKKVKQSKAGKLGMEMKPGSATSARGGGGGGKKRITSSKP